MSKVRPKPNRLTADNADFAEAEKNSRPRLPLSAPSAKSAVKNSEPETGSPPAKLPRGWVVAKIGDVTVKKVAQQEPAGSGAIRYIDIGSIDNLSKRIVEAKRIPAATAPSRARQLVKAGDVLVSMTRPNLNAVAVVPDELDGATASTGFDVLRSNGTVLAEWLFQLVRSKRFVDSLTLLVQGALYPAVRPSNIRDFEFPLPPLAEQRRIVARLEALEARSSRARALLAEVPAQLAQARQSLLAAAFRGDLTADWRERHANKSEHCPIADAETSWDIPKGWVATQLKNLIPPGGLFDGPFGSHLKSDDYTATGVRVIRLENIGHLQFDDDKRTFVSRAKFETLRRHEVREGDLIFASFIFEPLRVCILPALDTEAIAKADCFCLRPQPLLVDRKFICFQLACPGVAHRLKDSVHGATRPRINLTQLREQPVAWCPLPEQHEIVRRLSAALARLDAAARAHAAAVAELDRLDQSLLARAFSGTLVPQAPADVPAAAIFVRKSTIRDKQLGLAKARP